MPATKVPRGTACPEPLDASLFLSADLIGVERSAVLAAEVEAAAPMPSA